MMTPDEDLLWFIDNIEGDVLKWGAEPHSTEEDPRIRIEIFLPSPVEYIEINLKLPEEVGTRADGEAQ